MNRPEVAYTIAVCTRNRATLLRRTLLAVLAQIDAETELIVVDNNSTDQTREVMQSFTQIHYFCESTLGIARTRNRASQEAHGRWLIYVDDDAVPAAGWFAQMQRCIKTVDARCVIGKVDLEWENGRAAWFPESYEVLLSRYDLGDYGHFVGEGGYLLTTNAAFDRPHLLDLGGFRTDLGHQGPSLLGGEDNDIFNRLIESGSRIWYEPQALVMHWVPLERQQRRWLIRRVFWDGATQPLLDYGSGLPRRRYLSEAGRDLRRIVRITLAKRHCLRTREGRLDLFLEWTRQIGRFSMNWKLMWH